MCKIYQNCVMNILINCCLKHNNCKIKNENKKIENNLKKYNLFIHIKMNKVIIDNCIVSKFAKNGVRIRTIALEKKINPSFNINSLKKITYKSKSNDNQIIKQLCDGVLKYENLNFELAI